MLPIILKIVTGQVIKEVADRTLNKVVATSVTSAAVGAATQAIASAQVPSEGILFEPAVRELLVLILPQLGDAPALVAIIASIVAAFVGGGSSFIAGYFKKESSSKLAGLVTK